MEQNPIEQFVNTVVGAFAGSLGDVMAQIAVSILSILAMSPAIGSVLLVSAAKRWPIVERRALNAGIAGVVLTALSGLAVGMLFGRLLDNIFSLRTLSVALPYLALIAIGAATWFHYRNRATLSRARAVGIAGTVATPVTALLLDRLFS